MAYIGNVPAEKYIALTQQTFSSPTGTSFTLSQAVTNPVDIDLYIDNVKQDPASYSVSGTALTTSTIASPSTMYCIYNGKAMQTVNPPDGSVGTATVTDDAITLAKLAPGTDGNIISYDASGNPVAIATGSDGQVLTSTGAGSPPAFETAAAGGKVVQVVNTQTGAVITGTTQLPYDDTIPQSGEGVEVMTLAITPTSATNKLLIEVVSCVATSAGGDNCSSALFQDSTAGALAAKGQYIGAANASCNLNYTHYMAAGTTSSTTFKVRVGVVDAATVTFNGRSTARFYGGVFSSSITITEIAV
jgi:hypothetical protein